MRLASISGTASSGRPRRMRLSAQAVERRAQAPQVLEMLFKLHAAAEGGVGGGVIAELGADAAEGVEGLGHAGPVAGGLVEGDGGLKFLAGTGVQEAVVAEAEGGP